MSKRTAYAVLKAIQGDTSEISDRDLLHRFTIANDQHAFATLFRRHSSLVLGVCRRALTDSQDAEDACQAVFVVLARKAKTIRWEASIANWLYATARKIAANSRAAANRRAKHEGRAARPNPAQNLDQMTSQELLTVLDEELDRLSHLYREPLVLCYLEALTRDEAARRLEIPLNTLKTRLDRGRKRLADALTRRGCGLGVGLLVLAASSSTSASPMRLAEAVTKAIGEASTTSATTLANEMILRTSLMKTLSAGLAAICVLSLGIGGVAVGWNGFQSIQERDRNSVFTQTHQTLPKVQPRLDLYGDPLPAGAVARLGSIQLRHAGLADFTFSADSKTLVSAGDDRTLRIWDVATGKLSRAVHLQGDAGHGRDVALSADSKLFAGHDTKTLVIWDAQTGNAVAQLPAPALARQRGNLLFSSDGQTLVGSDLNVSEVRVWKWRTGNEVVFRVPRPEGPVNVDSSTHLALSPDGKYLAAGPHMFLPLTIWDTSDGRQLCKIDARATVSSFSPDSKSLWVTTLDLGKGKRPSLRLYEVPSGKLTRELPLPGGDFYWNLACSPDGKIVAPIDTKHIYALRSDTGKELLRMGGERTGSQRAACYSPNGRLLASIRDGRIHLWDAATGKELKERAGAIEPAYGVAYSPDGRILATSGWVDPAINLWESTTGRLIRIIDPKWESTYVRTLTFSADGQMLAVGRPQGEIASLDMVTGLVRHTLRIPDPRPGNMAETRFFHLSPDGCHAITANRVHDAGGEPIQVSLWETNPVRLVQNRTFPEISRGGCAFGDCIAFFTPEGIMVADAKIGHFRLAKSGDWSSPLVASPDGSLLAAFEKQQARVEHTVHVWEASTGKTIAKIDVGHPAHLALSPDGRTLVSCDPKALRLWDLALGKERDAIVFNEDIHFVSAGGFTTMYSLPGLVLSPDGWQATTAMQDGTLLVWALPKRSRPPVLGFAKVEVDRLWNDLSADDATKAYAAIWRLEDASEAAVAILGKHVKSVEAVDAGKVHRLLQDLDSKTFSVRESASRELANAGPIAVRFLKEAIAGNPSSEVRRRIEEILSKQSNGNQSTETLRHMRSIQVLKHIGSSEARRILNILADGAPGAPETEAAKSALRK